MRNILFIIFASFLSYYSASGQDRPQPVTERYVTKKETTTKDLPGLKKCILDVQENVVLFSQNYSDHSKETDVNTIILDIEKTIDSMHKTKTYAEQLLGKYFTELRHFFLTTTNKTSVAASFLYKDAPYHFCYYNDTALTLYVAAIKNGETYNLSKTTEQRIMKKVLENCLLPSLQAMELKDNTIKYVALSVYYGCKDTREGAPAMPVIPYCLTGVFPLADVQQYAAGLMTIKGMLQNAELYASDATSAGEIRRVQVQIE